MGVYNTSVSSSIQKFQADIQNELNEFNKENVEYQAKLQKAIEGARLGSQDDVQKIQKHSGEVTSYQAEVGKEIQEYSNNTKREMEIWQTQRQTELQKYSADIQNELNEFNKENAEYQAELQKSIETGRLLSQDDNKKIQNYAQEIGSYSSNINKEIQEYQSNLSQVIQESGVNLQRTQIKTQALTQQYQQCESKYQAELGRLNKGQY
jgi:hypothetical protein